MTPLGGPVVPEEYGKVARSSKKLKFGIVSGYWLPESRIILENERSAPGMWPVAPTSFTITLMLAKK